MGKGPAEPLILATKTAGNRSVRRPPSVNVILPAVVVLTLFQDRVHVEYNVSTFAGTNPLKIVELLGQLSGAPATVIVRIKAAPPVAAAGAAREVTMLVGGA